MEAGSVVTPESSRSSIAWTGGTPLWHARGTCLMWGPQIVGYRFTKVGTRFAAWRRNRSGVKP